MKKFIFLLFSLAIFNYANAERKIIRDVEPGEHTGFSVHRWDDEEDPITHIVCFGCEEEDCSPLCPMSIAPVGGGEVDPVSQSAANALFGQCDLLVANGDYDETLYLNIQVIGEENLRHYRVIMAFDSGSGMAKQTFERLD